MGPSIQVGFELTTKTTATLIMQAACSRASLIDVSNSSWRALVGGKSIHLSFITRRRQFLPRRADDAFLRLPRKRERKKVRELSIWLAAS